MAMPPYRITIGRPLPVLDCGPVGATRLYPPSHARWRSRFVPAASGATGDLTVTVSTLQRPADDRARQAGDASA